MFEDYRNRTENISIFLSKRKKLQKSVWQIGSENTGHKLPLLKSFTLILLLTFSSLSFLSVASCLQAENSFLCNIRLICSGLITFSKRPRPSRLYSYYTQFLAKQFFTSLRQCSKVEGCSQLNINLCSALSVLPLQANVRRSAISMT